MQQDDKPKTYTRRHNNKGVHQTQEVEGLYIDILYIYLREWPLISNTFGGEYMCIVEKYICTVYIVPHFITQT